MKRFLIVALGLAVVAGCASPRRVKHRKLKSVDQEVGSRTIFMRGSEPMKKTERGVDREKVDELLTRLRRDKSKSRTRTPSSVPASSSIEDEDLDENEDEDEDEHEHEHEDQQEDLRKRLGEIRRELGRLQREYRRELKALEAGQLEERRQLELEIQGIRWRTEKIDWAMETEWATDRAELRRSHELQRSELKSRFGDRMIELRRERAKLNRELLEAARRARSA